MATNECLLCLAATPEHPMVKLFDDILNPESGVQLNVSDVLSKHYWFEFNKNKDADRFVCAACWTKASGFHDFYEMVLALHQLRIVANPNDGTLDYSKPYLSSQTLEPFSSKSGDKKIVVEIHQFNDGSNDDDHFADEEDKLVKHNVNQVGKTYVFDEKSELSVVDDDNTRRSDGSRTNDELIDSKLLDLAGGTRDDEDKVINVPSGCRTPLPSKSEELNDKYQIVDQSEPSATQENTEKRRRGRPRKVDPFSKDSFDQTQAETIDQQEHKSVTHEFVDEEEGEPQEHPTKRKRGRPRKLSPGSERKSSPAPERIAQFFSVKCDICEAQLSDLCHAKSHYKTEHNEDGYLVCCEKKFYRQSSIREHCQFHEDPSLDKCYDCAKVFMNADRLERHRIYKHPTDGETMFGCTECDRSFYTQIALKMHQHRHANNLSDDKYGGDDQLLRRYIPMSCDLCGDGLESFNGARFHHQTVHGHTGYLVCCGRKFYKKFRAIQHCEWHADPKKFDCQTCGKNFMDMDSLREHMLRLHGPETDRAFQCDKCNRSFQQKSQLNYHNHKLHLADEDKKYECYICSKRFVFLCHLQTHMKGIHDPVPSFVCDVCAKYFKSHSSYELHYAIEHTDVCQKVQCQVCGKWLKHEQTLKRHMFFHRALPEACDQCGHVAPSKRALYSHRRLVHRDPTHKCLVCGKMFKKAHTLKEHMAIHAGIKDLYTCAYCPKTFRSSSNMYKHRKHVHSLEYEEFRRANAASVMQPDTEATIEISNTHPN